MLNSFVLFSKQLRTQLQGTITTVDVHSILLNNSFENIAEKQWEWQSRQDRITISLKRLKRKGILTNGMDTGEPVASVIN